MDGAERVLALGDGRGGVVILQRPAEAVVDELEPSVPVSRETVASAAWGSPRTQSFNLRSAQATRTLGSSQGRSASCTRQAGGHETDARATDS